MNFLTRPFKNQNGVTLAELLIGMGLSVFVISAAMIVFYKQDQILKDQNANVKTHGIARYGMEDVVQLLRMVGYGVPPAEAITDASSTSITYLANMEDVSSRITNSLAAGDTAITVVNAAGFAADQDVAIRNVHTGTYDLDSIDAVAGNIITLDSGVTVAYSNSFPVTINSYRTYELSFSSNSITVSIDGGADIVQASNVANFSLDYKAADGTDVDISDPANFPDISKILVTLSFDDPENDHAWATFNSEIRIRNM